MLFKRNNSAPSNAATSQPGISAPIQRVTVQDFELAVRDAACATYEAMKLRSDALATQFNVSQDSTFNLMLRKLNDHDNGLFVDGRAAIWRARIRLYRADWDTEVIADSDPDLDPRENGKTLHITIPAMIKWVVEFVENNSNGFPSGLDSATMQRRTRSLRTMISTRKDGTGRMSLDYTVQGVDMIARVDIKRESGTAAFQAKTAADHLKDSIARNKPDSDRL
jgi:hypothetical protein